MGDRAQKTILGHGNASSYLWVGAITAVAARFRHLYGLPTRSWAQFFLLRDTDDDRCDHRFGRGAEWVHGRKAGRM